MVKFHAKSLGFIHPTKNKWVNFESELPKDFKKMLDLLKILVVEKLNLIYKSKL